MYLRYFYGDFEREQEEEDLLNMCNDRLDVYSISQDFSVALSC